MRFKTFKIGKIKEEPDENNAETGDATATQIAGLEEQVNNKTKELEATKQELQELSDKVNGSEEDENTPPQPHGPLDELTVRPDDELVMDDQADVVTLMGNSEEEVKVTEVVAGEVAPANAENAEVAVDENDSLSDLFSQDEEEVNPLASLINSLPDVTAQELLDDLQEIKEIINEQRHN